MLPTLSHLSVSIGPVSRLRHWYSFRYLRISPLHRKFHFPLTSSRSAVSETAPGLSPDISSQTHAPAYELFTPSNSGQRLLPTSYRGCWHVVSRCLFLNYTSISSLKKEVYNPKTFVPHATLLCQACAHCRRFPTAAFRRSLDRVSVPVWLIIL